MTGQQAIQVLQKPVFGDEKCIEAKHILEMAEELALARQWAKGRGISSPLVPIAINCLDHHRLSFELNYWRNCGYEDSL